MSSKKLVTFIEFWINKMEKQRIHIFLKIVCVCDMCEGICGGQKRALETLEPELQMITWYMDDGKWAK